MAAISIEIIFSVVSIDNRLFVDKATTKSSVNLNERSFEADWNALAYTVFNGKWFSILIETW